VSFVDTGPEELCNRQKNKANQKIFSRFLSNEGLSTQFHSNWHSGTGTGFAPPLLFALGLIKLLKLLRI